MFKRDDGAAEDDFVTKTNRSRKKSSKALTGTAGDDTPDTSGSSGSAATATSAAGGAAGGASGESTNISLRPRTMFSMKGRGRTDSDGSPAAYRPQWSKDGDGFVSNTPAKDADGGAADGARRKGKVLRYSKEELLALHVVTEAVPALLVEAAVASEIALDPVDSEPFEYEEVYKQWALNRNRGRGRGRTTTGTTSGTTQNSNDNGDRSRSNGKWEENKWDRSKRDQNGEDGGSWQRDTSNDSSSIWDDVGVGGSDGMEMDLSAMALAAEKFRLEMDAMRNEVEGISRGEQAEVTDMDAFDQKLEEAVKAGQFEDSDEEVQWDMPLETDAPKHLEDDSTIMFSAPAFDTKPSVRDDSAFSLSSLSDATFGLRSLAVEVEVRDEWYYLDPQGLQQGPFKTAEMREWFEAGYFKPDLPIQFGQGGVFTPLANHFVQGQIPFASIPRPSPKLTIEQEMRMREEQRLMEIHQQQQQQQRMMQLQQQQEQQRLFQFNQEEKIRLEMQRLELERQQQHHLFQQQQQHMHQQQQQQQQQQQLLLQQQSSWQRSQREGIMSALGIFGGESQIGHLHQGTSLPIQHDYRETRHMDINPLSRLHDPVYTENNHARHHDPWSGGANAQLPKEPQADHGFFSGRPLSPMKTPSPKRAENSSTVHSDPWHTESAPPSVEPTQTRSTVSPAAEQPSPVSAKTKVPSPVKEPVKSSPVKKPAESSTRPSAWGNVQQPPSNTQSLKDIQADEQQELRKNLEGERTDLAHMGAQLKMMLGVNAAQQSQPAPAPVQQPVQAPAPAHAPAPTPAPVPAPSQPTASPWGRAATAAPQLETKKSMREILEEEERLAIERAKRSEGSGVSSSHWMNVVAGTTAPAAAAPKVSRLGPVPASVLKSTTRQGRASVGGDATAAAAAKKPAVTPGKPESDASFWNFGAAQSAKPATSSTAPSFGNGNHSSEFMSWCAKQIKSINGSDDLTLVEYCATLEDPGEIREYLAAYLGSTPRVSAFATEFIQRKRSSPKKPTTETSAASTSDFSDGAKKGKRRTKGQKIDPSLLNYSVGS